MRSISFSANDLHNEEAFRRQGRLPEDGSSPLAVRRADLEDLAEQLRLLKRDCAAEFASGFISDPPERLDRIIGDYYRGINGAGPMPAPRCTAPWIDRRLTA